MLRHVRNTGKAWALVGILLAGLLAAGPAMAQQAGGHRPSPLTPEDRAAMAQIFWHRAQASLGLTDQQVTDLRALLEAQRATTRTSVQSLRAARKQLRTLFEQQTSDPAAIQAVATQIKTGLPCSSAATSSHTSTTSRWTRRSGSPGPCGACTSGTPCG